jgi:uncharacterized protein (DUF1778 family)
VTDLSKSDARQPKDAVPKERVHIMMNAAWLKVVDRAARRLNISRSSFIARAAYVAAGGK